MPTHRQQTYVCWCEGLAPNKTLSLFSRVHLATTLALHQGGTVVSAHQRLLFVCHQDGFAVRLSSNFFWRKVFSTNAEISSQNSSLSSFTPIKLSAVKCPSSVSSRVLGASQWSYWTKVCSASSIVASQYLQLGFPTLPILWR